MAPQHMRKQGHKQLLLAQEVYLKHTFAILQSPDLCVALCPLDQIVDHISQTQSTGQVSNAASASTIVTSETQCLQGPSGVTRCHVAL